MIGPEIFAMAGVTQVRVCCSYCDRAIVDEPVSAVLLVTNWNDADRAGREQQFFAHLPCFVATLSKKATVRDDPFT